MFDIQKIARKLTRLLASNTFLYIIIGFFIFEALWFVFSARYPMAFDEDFHFGIIKLYAEQWSPFLTQHPAGADAFGAVVRDPSYLFHYLMSFPYRLIHALTGNDTLAVIVLRLINVALFTWGLLLFRKVLLRARTSPALTHTALAITALIPIVPQLAAQINYDNLVQVLFAWLCLVTFRLIDGFGERRVDMRALLTFVAICLFVSVVKYTALPLLLAAVLFVAYMAWRSFRGQGKRLLYRLKDGYLRLSKRAKVVLLVVLAVGSVLFVQRYVVNVVQYGGLVPDCAKVLTVEQCKRYGPWGRDYYLEQNRPPDFSPNIAAFAYEWLRGMRHRLFFAVNGPHANYANRVELPIPVATATVVFTLALIALAIYWRRVFANNPYYAFFGLLIGVYTAILFAEQYSMFAQTGVPVAINGRYLVPVLLPMAALLGTAVAIALRKWRKEHAKAYLASAAILLFLHGGGLLTFILRSDASWYWPERAVIRVNDAARTILEPAIIEGNKNAHWQ